MDNLKPGDRVRLEGEMSVVSDIGDDAYVEVTHPNAPQTTYCFPRDALTRVADPEQPKPTPRRMLANADCLLPPHSREHDENWLCAKATPCQPAPAEASQPRRMMSNDNHAVSSYHWAYNGHDETPECSAFRCKPFDAEPARDVPADVAVVDAERQRERGRLALEDIAAYVGVSADDLWLGVRDFGDGAR